MTNEMSPTVIITKPVALSLTETVMTVSWTDNSRPGSNCSTTGSSGVVTSPSSVVSE